MDNKEAIKRIREFGLHHAIGDLPNSALTVKSFNMAISVLEKQIPKKTIRVNVGSNGSSTDGCPICKREFYEKFNFCPDCGQAIDWN